MNMMRLPRLSFFWVAIGVTAFVGTAAWLSPLDTIGGTRPAGTPVFSQTELQTDVLVYGGSIGGLSTAITVAKSGRNVVLATESEVLGGQATESGISAFDDMNNPWENHGLYSELIQFLNNRHGNDHAGLGKARVGKVASPAKDIEAFFLQKITENPRITLLKNYRLTQAKKDGTTFQSVVLANVKTQERVLVRFSYIVSASQTGQSLKELDLPFDVGFDTIEETAEPHAIPQVVRDAFVKGFKDGVRKFAGWGNRVQAIASPFVLLDRGFTGDFFPLDQFPAKDCWHTATTESFIVGASVFQSTKALCLAEVKLSPAFSDTYDVYFINHGAKEIRATMRWPAPALTLNSTQTINPKQQHVKVGTFFIDPANPPTLSFSTPETAFSVEGVLLVKTNMHHPPVLASAPFAESVVMKRSGFALVSSDIYLTTKEDGKVPPSLSLSLNGTSYQVPLAYKNTYVLHDIMLGHTGAFILPAETRTVLTTIAIFPTGLAARRATFAWTLPTVENGAKQTPQPIKTTWDFTVNKSGNYVFGIDWPQKMWLSFALYDAKTNREIARFSYQPRYPGRGVQPIRVIPLTAGIFYSLKADPSTSTAEAWNPPPILSLEALEGSNYHYVTSKSNSARTVGVSPTAMYNAWVRGPGKSIKVRSALTFMQNFWSDVTGNHATTFTFAGKYFLFPPHDLSTEGASELLLYPSLQEDVYHYTRAPGDTSLSLDITTLPPGQWSMLLTALATPDIAQSLSALIRHPDSALPDQEIPLFSIGFALMNKSAFQHQSTASLSIANLPGEIQHVWFFEQVPDLLSSWEFTLIRRIIGKPTQGELTPLFPFRNIVSSGSLVTGRFTDPSNGHVARTTMGATIIAEPSNDYAPVYADSIESRDTLEASRQRSYAYYYWLKYIAQPIQRFFDCDAANDPTCSLKRTSLLLGMFPGSPEIFGTRPYYREGRRGKTVDRMTEADLGLQMCDSGSPACNATVCFRDKLYQSLCLLKKQEFTLPKNAVAAVHYGLDVHAFYSQNEYFDTDGISAFIQYWKDKKILNTFNVLSQFPPLVRPSSLKLGSLIPRDTTNVILASNNIGMTQIANSALRTHLNELVIGETAGYLLAFCLSQNIAPKDLNGDLAKVAQFQHFLVERGAVIYPIRDMNDDPTLSKAVQHMIIDGLLVPELIPLSPGSTYHSFQFVVGAATPLAASDNALIQRIFGDEVSIDVFKPATVTTLFTEMQEQMTAERKLSLLSLIGLPQDTTKNPRVTRAHLFRAIYLAKGKTLRWF